jgi:hypothetical protein
MGGVGAAGGQTSSPSTSQDFPFDRLPMELQIMIIEECLTWHRPNHVRGIPLNPAGGVPEERHLPCLPGTAWTPSHVYPGCWILEGRDHRLPFAPLSPRRWSLAAIQHWQTRMATALGLAASLLDPDIARHPWGALAERIFWGCNQFCLKGPPRYLESFVQKLPRRYQRQLRTLLFHGPPALQTAAVPRLLPPHRRWFHPRHGWKLESPEWRNLRDACGEWGILLYRAAEMNPGPLRLKVLFTPFPCDRLEAPEGSRSRRLLPPPPPKDGLWGHRVERDVSGRMGVREGFLVELDDALNRVNREGRLENVSVLIAASADAYENISTVWGLETTL